MKKILKITVVLLGILLILTLTDFFSIVLFDTPLIALKDNSDSTNIKYKGIFYDTYKCLTKEDAVIKLKGTKYTCPVEIEEEFTITDTSKNIKDFACAQALEEIYKDDEYSYYLNCIKSKYIIVEYKSGKKENIKEALKNKNIRVEDLNRFNIDYIKVVKE